MSRVSEVPMYFEGEWNSSDIRSSACLGLIKYASGFTLHGLSFSVKCLAFAVSATFILEYDRICISVQLCELLFVAC